MKQEQAQKTIRDLFDKLWIPSDLSQIDHFYHPDVEAYVSRNTLDYQALYDRIAYNKANLENYQVEFHDFIYQDDKLVVRMEQQAYDKRKQSKLYFHVIAVYAFLDQKIHRLWAELTGNLDLEAK